MAENAANISSIQHQKPNILELVAQESFMDSIYPAFKTLCTYTAGLNISHLSWLEKWYDETFLCTNFVLQYYYLKVFCSSFSEAFYGLKRIPASSSKLKSYLPASVISSSLFFLVFIPYISRKLQYLERDYDSNSQRESRRKKIIFLTLKVRSCVGIIYGSFKLYYLISYLTGRTKVHDPLLKLANVELVYQNRRLPSWRDMLRAVFFNKSDSSKMRMSLFFKLMGASFEIGAFFIQFLNWWHLDESKKVSNLPLPKPPHLNTGSDVCPICHSKRKNEVVLFTSGYVYCYACIKDCINRKGMCPLTNLPSSVDNIVRIYSTS